MSRGKHWLLMGVVLLLTLGLTAAMGAWRAAQHAPIAWSTVRVGESIERHGLRVQVLSLAATQELPPMDSAVWVEVVFEITPTSQAGLTPFCSTLLRSGGDQWSRNLFANGQLQQPGECLPTDAASLVIGQPWRVHNYFEIPATALDQARVKVEFYDPSWAVMVRP